MLGICISTPCCIICCGYLFRTSSMSLHCPKMSCVLSAIRRTISPCRELGKDPNNSVNNNNVEDKITFVNHNVHISFKSEKMCGW